MANLFISYSHQDERALKRLHTHLAMLKRERLISTWFDREILAGRDIDKEVETALRESEVFIALVSPDFLASRYCYELEMQKALERHDNGTIVVIPVIVEACDWQSSPLAKLKALPKDGKAISTWTNEDVAYLDVVMELRRAFSIERKQHQQPSAQIKTSKTPSPPVAAKRYRIQKEFDAIDRAEFAAGAFRSIRIYFEKSINELNEIGDPIRARFEKMSEIAFTCTVLNKASRDREAHITIHLQGERGFGDISYSFKHRASSNTSNGHISVSCDDYEQYLSLNSFNSSSDRERFSADEAAEQIWREFISQAGIEHD